MTQSAAASVVWSDFGCGLWCVITAVVLISIHRYFNQPPEPLLDLPNQRSHPRWKSSRNLCLKLNLTTAIRV